MQATSNPLLVYSDSEGDHIIEPRSRFLSSLFNDSSPRFVKLTPPLIVAKTGIVLEQFFCSSVYFDGDNLVIRFPNLDFTAIISLPLPEGNTCFLKFVDPGKKIRAIFF